jgi:NhaA family Na+:H+ antiporter
MAGVMLAICIPHHTKHSHGKNQLLVMQEFLYPMVTFFIIPLFAIINKNVPVKEVSLEEILSPLSLGIIFGLFIGKQTGVFGATYLLIKYGKAKLPANTCWLQLYGVSVLCGIGFTMSLFIGALAF